MFQPEKSFCFIFPFGKLLLLLMKNRSALLSSRIRDLFLSGKWIANTNFADQLQNTNIKAATTKFGKLNTIAALTFHVNYYIQGLNDFFQNGKLDIHDKFSFDMPVINTDNDWSSLKNALLKNAELFAILIGNLTNEQLDSVFVLEKYGTVERNIEAMIEHGYYHLGQISLLNKMIENPVSR